MKIEVYWILILGAVIGFILLADEKLEQTAAGHRFDSCMATKKLNKLECKAIAD